ncbi:MAG: RICIN domain-containing protein, partial [Pseudomonadota bacterium]|nr:RICIN domain-containing protein [Pseudomonadota bacterium]
MQASPSAAVLPSAVRYVFANVNSGKCIDVAGASTASGGNIQQSACNGNLAQAFDVTEVSSDVYKLINANSGKAMDVASASTADGANVQQWDDNGTTAQQFRLERTAGNRYTLLNVNSGKCVDVAAASTADGANVQQYTCNGTAAQQFYLYPRGATATSVLPIGEYQAKAASSSLCLDIAGASTADGAKAQQSACSASSTSQDFEFVGDSAGSYRISDVNSGKALDVSDVSAANGALIQQWTAGGSDNQRFNLAIDGTGFTLKALNSGRCVDVVNNSTTAGAQIQQWDCAGSANQRWQLTPVGDTSTGGTPVPSPFGPNVFVFDPTMSASAIQSQADTVFNTQQSNQFGQQRYAMLFKPGTYNASVHVGFYTQVAGLGMSPDDVTINGTIESNAAWFNGNATQNFWRMAENMAVVPSGGTEKWAVSQASPFRRMHVRGNLVLDDGGWSSGGFISDSKIDDQVNSGGQQQWFTRNSQLGSWTGSGWNMVFAGTTNAPTTSAWPNPPYTTVAQTPVSREKPFVIWTGSQ